MEKPVVFLAHASADAQILAILRRQLLAKSGNSIEIFLSSDGQSIPFGRNWVREVEAALSDSALMFVMLSPSSVRSQWVLFEAGFAYAKGVQVVPVAILGLNLSQVSPPLSLLQGFNVQGPEALANVMAIINRHFGTTFEETFTKHEYEEISGGARTETPIQKYVEELTFVASVHPDVTIECLLETVKTLGFDCKSWHGTIQAPGMQLEISLIGQSRLVEGTVDGSVLESSTLKFLDELIEKLDGKLEKPKMLTLRLFGYVGAITSPYKLTARLIGSGVELAEDGLRFENLVFAMSEISSSWFGPGERQPLRVLLLVFPGDSALGDLAFNRLLDVLLQRHVLWVREPAYFQ